MGGNKKDEAMRRLVDRTKEREVTYQLLMGSYSFGEFNLIYHQLV